MCLGFEVRALVPVLRLLKVGVPVLEGSVVHLPQCLRRRTTPGEFIFHKLADSGGGLPRSARTWGCVRPSILEPPTRRAVKVGPPTTHRLPSVVMRGPSVSMVGVV